MWGALQRRRRLEFCHPNGKTQVLGGPTEAHGHPQPHRAQPSHRVCLEMRSGEMRLGELRVGAAGFTPLLGLPPSFAVAGEVLGLLGL